MSKPATAASAAKGAAKNAARGAAGYDGRVAPGLSVGPSRIDGRGCFAARRMRGKRRLHICAIDSYWGIDGSRGGNGSQFINHSCRPNSFVRITHGHVIFFALRDIEPGEEITLDYVESYHPDDYGCRCGAAGCRGTINVIRKR